jgi:hypothetical protein
MQLSSGLHYRSFRLVKIIRFVSTDGRSQRPDSEMRSRSYQCLLMQPAIMPWLMALYPLSPCGVTPSLTPSFPLQLSIRVTEYPAVVVQQHCRLTKQLRGSREFFYEQFTNSTHRKRRQIRGTQFSFPLPDGAEIAIRFSFVSGPAQSPGISSPCSLERCWLSAVTMDRSSRQRTRSSTAHRFARN